MLSTDKNSPERSLIILGKGQTVELLSNYLSSNFWSVINTDSKEKLSKHLQSHLFQVVVIFFSADDDPSIIEFEELASIHMSSKWIAVLPSSDWLENHPNFLFSHIFYDYHREPIRFELFLATLGHAYGMAELQSKQLNQLQISSSNEEIVGKSSVVNHLKRTIKKIALEDATVLISGESGTGKELVARSIHNASKRKGGPFIAINCAAIPETLFYSELFGHNKGAFTGANEDKIGRIEAAAGGTLFLDEIGDLPLNMQVNLLRFLELNQIERLGTVESTQVDCRILVATHVDLIEAVNNEAFREDLYHRINVLPLEIPPLRKRKEDIPLLANFFLQQFCKGQALKTFSQSCLRAIAEYHWPGNVRELMNRVRRAVILSDSNIIYEKQLDLAIISSSSPQVSLKEAKNKTEKEALISSMELAGYNHTLAAKNLDISRTSLYRLLHKHHIPA